VTVVIHKQVLKLQEYQEFTPHGEVRAILDVQLQDHLVCMWYEFDPESGPSFRTNVQVFLVGTGNQPPGHPFSYVATTQVQGFVWHWYAQRIFRSGSPVPAGR
jgi:hypothetical protein